MGNSCRKSACLCLGTDEVLPRNSKLDRELLEAAKAADLAGLEELAEQGADLNATGLMGETPLVIAAKGGHLGIVRYLASQPGVDVNAKGKYHRETALMKAAEKGQLAVVTYLAEECDADVNAIASYGQTALARAAANGHCDIVRYLAERGADVNVEDRRRSTAVMEAASRGHVEVVRYLAEECGVDANAFKAGTTPLIEAVGMGHLAVVQYLVEERGVDVNVRDQHEYGGFTALTRAATHRHVDIVRYLVERGNVDIDMTDLDGNTALMRAASSGYVEIVRYLAEEYGADVDIENTNGKTALQLATEKGYQETQHVLTQFLRLPAARHASDRAANSDRVLPSLDDSTRWTIPPSEIALIHLSEKGNVGGEYCIKWLDADAVVKLFVPVSPQSDFEKQVQLWGQLRHPNAIKMYGACDAGPHLKFFVCEYADKGSLLHHIEMSSVEKPMIWKFLYEAALGLEYLHERGIVHGDLRCSNILIGSDGLAKLSSFRASGLTSSSGLAVSGVAGPLHWQAPEILFQHRSSSFASDVYSLGLCIVEAVTGKRPWDSSPERHVISAKRKWTPSPGHIWDWHEYHMYGTWPRHKERYYMCTDDYGKHAPLCPSEVARQLVSRMCCNSPDERASISAVVYDLERLAIKESASCDPPEHLPSNTFDEYKWKEVQDVWTDVKMFMETCGNSQYCRVFGELKGVRKRLKNSRHRPMLLARFHKLLAEFNWVINMSPEQAQITRLSATRAPSSSFYAFNWRIQSLLAALSESEDERGLDERDARWQEQRSEQVEIFVAGVTDVYLLLQKLKSTEERLAFLRHFKTQIDAPVSNYTPDQLCLMKNAYDDMVSRLETEDWSKLAPEWFIPWYELIIDKWSKLGSGGFGSVYQGTWLDSDVVVKLVGVDCDHDAFSLEYSTYESQVKTQLTPEQRAKATTTFRREADIWFGLNHPHVIRLFGACHVGRPFFVCEYATNGTLVSYLQKHPDQLWTKLHEAALGVQYLHARNVVHGDLKGNNIVVGSDFKAKVTDFGLSSITDSEAKPEVSAAVHWVAPECLPQTKSKPQTPETERPTFASDIYSLGMCIVEALRVVEAVSLGNDTTRCQPWGIAEQPVVKFYVEQGKLPPRPTICEGRPWELVERMCVLNPKKRIKISTVVDELESLAHANNQEDELTINSPTDLEHVPTVVAAARQVLTQLQQHTDQRVAELSLYRDLWSQLERIHGLIDASCGAAGRSAFSSLVADAELATQQLPTRKANLTSLAESTLRCHALRRRLDKFCEAYFLDME